jgi:hypothetical protein
MVKVSSYMPSDPAIEWSSRKSSRKAELQAEVQATGQDLEKKLSPVIRGKDQGLYCWIAEISAELGILAH